MCIRDRYDGDAFKRVVYTESHDEVANGKARVPEEIWPGNSHHWFAKKRSTMGAVLVFTAPGIPMIFQGQEFLEDKWFDDTDPLDWDKAKEMESIITLYRDPVSYTHLDVYKRQGHRPGGRHLRPRGDGSGRAAHS